MSLCVARSETCERRFMSENELRGQPAGPLWLLAELTYRCPLHCVYCSNPVEYTRYRSELSTESWIRVLREGRELGFVQLDQILRLAPRAVERVVDMLGRSGLNAGDDKADIETLGGGLDAGAGTAVDLPGFGLVAGLSEAA